jgi:hypothetical protein
VQVITGASVDDRRNLYDFKVSKRLGEWSFGISGARSKEEDYFSRAVGFEAKLDMNDRNTTITAGYGRVADRVRSSDDPTLDAPRDTDEYLLGLTQVLSPVAVVQSTLQWNRGDGLLQRSLQAHAHVLSRRRPGVRRRHAPGPSQLGRLAYSLPPSLRRVEGNAASRLSLLPRRLGHPLAHPRSRVEPVAGRRLDAAPGASLLHAVAGGLLHARDPAPQPAILSSDQRLAAFGGISPSLRATLQLASGWRFEGTLGYVENASRFTRRQRDASLRNAARVLWNSRRQPAF